MRKVLRLTGVALAFIAATAVVSAMLFVLAPFLLAGGFSLLVFVAGVLVAVGWISLAQMRRMRR